MINLPCSQSVITSRKKIPIKSSKLFKPNETEQKVLLIG